MKDRKTLDKPGYCSKCGGELDGEGWCANYCGDDEPTVRICGKFIPQLGRPCFLPPHGGPCGSSYEE
jgi:hypothetical protein